MNKRLLAIIAAIGATTIYGINHTIAKGIMPHYVQPFGFIILRVLGAAILFWLISPFGPKEKIDRKDYLRMIVCAFLGMGLNMLVFFKGLSLSTPINSAVLITTTPIIVLVLSAVILKEKISSRKILGIGIGLLGAFGLEEFMQIEWSTLPFEAYRGIVFVILGTTFCTYLFNIFALTQLKASTLSAFVYVQPLVGIGYAIITGQDNLTLVKIVAASFVLVGVYLASRQPKRFYTKK